MFESKDVPRESCGPSDKVYGSMAALTRYPFKLTWFERYAPELYDLSWDPEEQSELSKYRPDLVAELGAEIERFTEAAGLIGDLPEDGATPSEEAIETLKALGYVE